MDERSFVSLMMDDPFALNAHHSSALADFHVECFAES